MALLGGSLLPGASQAAQGCPEHFANGRMPTYLVAAYNAKTQLICNDGYAVLYSGQVRNALWVAEYLTPQRIKQARSMERDSVFKADERLPAAWRAELSDYVHSGFDRGHMAPSGDMPTAQAQAQSFNLSNIVPQDPGVNRGAWARVEDAVRGYAYKRPVYVITGVLFFGQKIGYLQGRVAVPSYLYKIVYDPVLGAGAGYVVANQPGARVQMTSIAWIATQAHLDFGWGTPKTLALPAPGAGYPAGEHR